MLAVQYNHNVLSQKFSVSFRGTPHMNIEYPTTRDPQGSSLAKAQTATDSSVANRIPPELQPYILCHLDNASVAACSLLSHHWRPHAQNHLLKEITLIPTHRRNENSLLEFLQSQPRVCHIIRVLKVKNSSRVGNPGMEIPERMVSIDILSSILGVLPMLSALYISRVDLISSRPFRSTVAPKSLDVVNLDSVVLGTISRRDNSTHNFLSSFGTISQLITQNVHVGVPPSRQTANTIESSKTLDELKICSATVLSSTVDSPRGVMDTLQNYARTSLQSLKICYYGDLRYLGRLIDAVSAQLVNLHLCIHLQTSASFIFLALYTRLT